MKKGRERLSLQRIIGVDIICMEIIIFIIHVYLCLSAGLLNAID